MSRSSPLRARLALLMALVAILSSLPLATGVAHAVGRVSLVQESQEQGDDGGEGGGGGGSEAEPEAGPPWTYQMARIAIILLIITLLAIAAAYYRFVVIRKRAGV